MKQSTAFWIVGAILCLLGWIAWISLGSTPEDAERVFPGRRLKSKRSTLRRLADPPDRSALPSGQDDSMAWHTSQDINESGLRILLMTQNPDGSWGTTGAMLQNRHLDKIGLTALALRGFFALGFSHLSKDEIDGRISGEAVRSGLQFLTDRQNANGGFGSAGSSGLPDALGGLALAHHQHMTGSIVYRENLRRALEHLSQEQLPCGSWPEPEANRWATLALALAPEPEGRPKEALQRALGWLGQGSPADLCGWLAAVGELPDESPWKPREWLPQSVGFICGVPDSDPAEFYWKTSATFSLWKFPEGLESWKSFVPRLKEFIRLFDEIPVAPTDEDVLLASFRLLVTERYYHLFDRIRGGAPP